jgi:ATP-dependent Clp protease adaptor protein ClpS
MSTATETQTKIKIKPVNMWRVVFHNDDYTPIDFVVEVLAQLFNKEYETAMQIAQNIHDNGRGVAGVYTKEVAQQKAADTSEIARKHGHPLKATAEES